MNQLHILTTAVIDEECIKISQESLFKNLIECNPKTEFLHTIHLDNHRRHNANGSIDSVIKIFQKYSNYYNYKIEILLPEKRVGLVTSAHTLFNRFLQSKFNRCFIFEDDTTLIKKLELEKIDTLFEKDVNMVHLAFCVITQFGGYSTENPFLKTTEELKNLESLNISYTDRNFEKKPSFTWNGTFFSRKNVEDFNSSYKLIHREDFFPEDQIGRFFYKLSSKEIVRTVFSKKKEYFLDGKSLMKDWESPNIPFDCHFLVDEIRFRRGRVGALL